MRLYWGEGVDRVLRGRQSNWGRRLSTYIFQSKLVLVSDMKRSSIKRIILQNESKEGGPFTATTDRIFSVPLITFSWQLLFLFHQASNVPSTYIKTIMNSVGCYFYMYVLSKNHSQVSNLAWLRIFIFHVIVISNLFLTVVQVIPFTDPRKPVSRNPEYSSTKPWTLWNYSKWFSRRIRAGVVCPRDVYTLLRLLATLIKFRRAWFRKTIHLHVCTLTVTLR